MTCAEPLFALALCEVLSEMIPSLMWEGYVVFSRVYQEENEAQRGGFFPQRGAGSACCASM